MFAGTQFGVECFCGNTSPKPELKLVDTACNKKCSGIYYISPKTESNIIQLEIDLF